MKLFGYAPLGALAAAALLAFAASPSLNAADEKTVENGKYLDKDGNPTFNIKPDGTVDWFTFSGFRRYHAECHVCHGPEGRGSSYAPALVESVKTMSYDDYKTVIIQGRRRVDAADNSVMPSFGDNRNVVCYIDDIWVYLRAAATGGLPPGRPAKKDASSPEYKEEEKACMG